MAQNEIEMIRMLPKLLPHFGDPIVFVELGVNDGYHTGLMLQWLEGLRRPYRYIGLEPDPRITPTAPIEFLRAAIAAKDGEVQLYLSEGQADDGTRYTGSSSLHPPGELIKKYWPKMEFNRLVYVPGITMDTLMERYKLPHIDFIWCDTQGCEDVAVLGGTKAFAAAKFFFTEYAEDQLYQGQATFSQLKAMLPTWVVNTDLGGDALLRNTLHVPVQVVPPPPKN